VGGGGDRGGEGGEFLISMGEREKKRGGDGKRESNMA